MWPWEHLAFGYVLYSVLARACGDRPGRRETLAVVAGTQLPDVVDKPLAWWLGVVPSARIPTHSLAVAVPLCLLVALAARRLGVGGVAVPFVVGYGSHLVGDVIYSALLGGEPATWFLLWPLVSPPPHGSPPALVKLGLLAERFLAFLATPRGRVYLLGEVALLAGAFLLWVRDGAPGVLRRGSTA